MTEKPNEEAGAAGVADEAEQDIPLRDQVAAAYADLAARSDDADKGEKAPKAEPKAKAEQSEGDDAQPVGDERAAGDEAEEAEAAADDQADSGEAGEGDKEAAAEQEPAAAEPSAEPAPELTQYKQFHDEVDAALKPWEAAIAQQGMTKPQAVQTLVSLYSQSVRDPAGFLTGLAQRYAPTVADPAQRVALVQAFARGLGVDVGGGAHPQPNGAANATGAPQGPPAGQPTVDERTIQQLVDQRLQEHLLQQSAKDVERQIKEFAEAKGEDGKPLRPHFETLRVTMSALMTADPSLTLQDAYDQALWTRPDLREQLTKAQQEQQARAAAEQRRQSVQKAKAAQTPRTASQPQPPPDLGDLPLRELVERNVRAAFSG